MPLEKTSENQGKAVENLGKKQVEALKTLKSMFHY